MGSSAKYIAAFFCLVLPGIARAQSVGQVECPRAGDYVYLYSSMTTLDVRTTLQCGERVQITGRSLPRCAHSEGRDRLCPGGELAAAERSTGDEGAGTKGGPASERAHSLRCTRKTRGSCCERSLLSV